MATDIRECPLCNRELAHDRPMVRAEVQRRRGGYMSRAIETVCTDCVTGFGPAPSPGAPVMTWGWDYGEEHLVTCAHCHSPVYVQPDRRRKVTTCSDRCRSRYYTARAKSVETPVTRQCEGCGADMGGRADRRWCSPACRQRAYRQRATL